MKSLARLTCAVLACWSAAIGPRTVHAVLEKLHSIFDRQTFDGWEVDIAHAWRIENRAISAGSLEKQQPATNSWPRSGNSKTSTATMRFRGARVVPQKV